MAAPRRSTGPGDEPMIARWGSEHPAVPLVVLLHGNGTSEHSLIEISPWLPHGPVAYVSVRAPIEQGRGYSWFTGPGDLLDVTRWLLRRLDVGLDAPVGSPDGGSPDRPVLLVGFREGVAVAGALMLLAPERFAGAVLVYGALPFDADVPFEPGRLRGLPVFVSHADDDPRTPAPLLARTREWLTGRSGAPVWIERGPGGDQLAGDVVAGLRTWLDDRLDFLRAHGESPLPDGDEPHWPALGGPLPPRAGEPVSVTPGVPQHQTTQNSPAPLQERLWSRLAALPGVTTADAASGIPGTRSLLLDPGGPAEAYVLPEAGEFAHLHPDGSLHLALPPALAYDALLKGWAVAHPLASIRLSAGLLLVPGPRDEAELKIVTALTTTAHTWASTPTPDPPASRDL